MPPMSFDPLARLRAAAAGREAAGLRRLLTARGPEPGGMLDLASNDYLGMCGDPRLAEAAAAAARAWGTGATGSRLVTGTTTLHQRLEEALAAFAGAPSALVFSSGYLANLAAVTALAAALGDVLIVSDELNHASLIDGCRLARGSGGSGARVQVTPHRDVTAVRAALAGRRERAALVVTDAVFSVSGDLAPLAGLHAAARDHQALLLIDEAHSFGVLGDGGRGAAWAAGIAAEPGVVRTVTLSKALAGQGGAVLGAAEVTGTVVDTGRGFIFDTGLAPPAVAAALAALQVLRADPGRGARAREAAGRLAGCAAERGLTVSAPAAAVTAVVLGDPADAVAAQRVCAAHGVRAGCFRPPSVPRGQACLRLTGRATLTEDDFATASRALAAVRDHCRIAARAGGKTP
ncbi:MAG: aminotransferase class I/II-fold pyridoxal phosphate-dependent enzyme [Streptosporangiaceae bacterium]|nr:aminotransferase class I/II-fold pyridoxal phosphate-dependent enzyme [Streptosporangiaceae bacterium]MBV9854663.1 aminotransferase class I/II-fold pyridoxal phosphate-dependent enzyme [Streptosporangiaceae bacterium]